MLFLRGLGRISTANTPGSRTILQPVKSIETTWNATSAPSVEVPYTPPPPPSQPQPLPPVVVPPRSTIWENVKNVFVPEEMKPTYETPPIIIVDPGPRSDQGTGPRNDPGTVITVKTDDPLPIDITPLPTPVPESPTVQMFQCPGGGTVPAGTMCPNGQGAFDSNGTYVPVPHEAELPPPVPETPPWQPPPGYMPDGSGTPPPSASTPPPSAGTQVKVPDSMLPPITIGPWWSPKQWFNAFDQLPPIKKGAIGVTLFLALLGAAAVAGERRQDK